MRFQNNGNIDFHVWESGAADTTGNDYIPLILKNDGDAYFNGNVGIGTASPHAKLEVNGTSKFDGNLIFGSAYTLVKPLSVADIS